MPKLLRKDILASNVISFVIAFVIGMIMLIFDDETPKSLFYAYNIVLFQCFTLQISTRTYSCALPDYIYIAPYSREQRKKLLQKKIIYKFWSEYIWQVLLVIAPLLIRCIAAHDMPHIIFCIEELIAIAGIIYSRGYYAYLDRTYPLRSAGMIMLTYIEIFLMPCDILEGSAVEKAIDAVLVLAFIIYSISLIIICRVKYRDEMITCLADYEYIKNQR